MKTFPRKTSRPASVPSLVLHTDRLSLLAFPTTLFVPEIRSKKGIRQLLKFGAADSRATSPIEQLCFYCIGLKEQTNVGVVTVTFNQESPICNLGYSIDSPHRGRGYATEAVQTVVDWILSTDAEAVIAETFFDWPHSIRVMEKAGLIRIESDLGPNLVRYAIAKSASKIDLTEQRVLTLKPFREPAMQSVLGYLQWLWIEDRQLTLMILFIAITYASRGNFWKVALATCGSLYFAVSTIRSFASWWPKNRVETYLQFREQGLFWANRNGNGGIVPWKNFTHWRMARRMAIELWNGESWYCIEPEAFSELPLNLIQKFLGDHGVEPGNPPSTVVSWET